MSQEARNQGPWRWLSGPRLWLRWWSEAVASGRDAVRSVWDWLFEDQDSPAAKKYKPKQAHLLVEQYEARETPDDLGNFLGISILGTLFDPPLNGNPFHSPAPVARVLDSLPSEAALASRPSSVNPVWDNDALFASADTQPAGTTGDAAQLRSRDAGAGVADDALAATLLLDLADDLFADGRPASLSAAGSSSLVGTTGGDSAGLGQDDVDPRTPGRGGPGGGDVGIPDDPFAWVQYADAGAGMGGATAATGTVGAATTTATDGGSVALRGPGGGTGGDLSGLGYGDDGLQPGGEEHGTVPATLAADFARTKVRFEANAGQVDPRVRFLSRGVAQTLFLTDSEAVLALAGPRTTDDQGRTRQDNDVLRVGFAEANPDVSVVGQDELATRSNYFDGADPAAWHTDVANYGAVRYRDLYDGVDLVWKPSDLGARQFRFDFRVAAHADHGRVLLDLGGADSVRLTEGGDLAVALPHGEVTLTRPVLYQERGGEREDVQGGYRLLEGNRVGFAVGEYDPTRELVIDPTVSWSSYSGGGGTDAADDIAVDAAGNVYVVGATASADFPTAGPYLTTGDVFAAKVSSDGRTLLYATYLGGSGASAAYALAVDGAGAAYLTGTTAAADFPMQGAWDSSYPGGSFVGDAFVTKLAPAGNALVYSSYLGSSGSLSRTTGLAIAVDTAGAAYVAGERQPGSGGSIPVVAAFQGSAGGGVDGWLAKVDPAGATLVYSTYYGGSGDDRASGVAITAAGEAVLVGDTTSTNLAVAGAVQGSNAGGADAFVAKFAATGATLVWATYLGGAGNDYGADVALDKDGDVYAVGDTASSGFPVRAAYQGTYGGSTDAFLTRVKGDGTTFTYSTFLGGAGTDKAYGVAVDAASRPWVAGYTTGSFTTVGALQSHGGGDDAFLAGYDAAGTLTFATYLGGSSADRAVAVALGAAGDPVLAGWTDSAAFPTQEPLYGNSAGRDAFVAKVNAAPWAKLTTVTNDTGASAADRITNDSTLTLSGTATPGATVTIYRQGVGVLGTATATGGGTFSYAYGATLADRDYAFTARATSAGATGAWSRPLLVTVDTTAPTVTLAAATMTTDFGPEVRVVATDLIGVPVTTTVTLDADLNNDNDFADPGEAGYQTATMTAGLAVFAVSPAVTTTGTRKLRARVTDLAGNQGTSAAATVTVVATASPWAPTLAVTGTDALEGDAALLEGSLSAGHALDLDRGPGASGFALAYDSQSADPRPVVTIQVAVDNSQPPPDFVLVHLTFTDGVDSWFTTADFTTDAVDPGEVLTLGAQIADVLPTGGYTWSILGEVYYGAGMVTFALDGYALVANRNDSQFGAGWSMAGVDRLVDVAAAGLVPAGKLRLYGSGRWAFYEDAGGGAFTSPEGDPGVLAAAGGGWEYASPGGGKVVFDAAGLQTAVVSPDGLSAATFTYSGTDLTGIRTPDGAVTTLTLSSGKVQTIQTAARTVTLTYATDDLARVTNPDGGVHTLTYGSHKLVGEQFGAAHATYGYDAYGLLSGWSPGGEAPVGLVPVAARGLGLHHAGAPHAAVVDAAGYVSRAELDPAGRVLTAIAPNGAVETYTRDPGTGWVTAYADPLGRTTSYSRDAAGYVTGVGHPDGSSVAFGYANDGFHSLTMSRDERGNVSTFAYDGQGHMTRATDALGRHTTYTYSSTTGLLETVKDARNNVTTYGYDSARRLETTRYADGGIETLTYDANGNVATRVDPRGITTTFTSDALGRTTRIDHPDGTYETAGYDGGGLAAARRDRGGVNSTTSYTARGQASVTTEGAGLALSRTNLYQYDAVGRATGVRDAAGNWGYVNYDAVGQAVGSTDALGGATANRYDLAGQLVQYRNEVGETVTNVHNLRGWVTESIVTATNRTTTTYDAAGNVTAFQDANGNRATASYDALNRAYQIQAASNVFATTSFDEVGNVKTVADPGNKVVTYAYDAMNRVRAVTNAEGETTTYGYDLAGNPVTVTNARGKTVTSVYDSMNRVVQTISPDNETTSWVYGATGTLTKVIDALGQAATYLYDALNQAVGYVNALGQQASAVLDALGRTVATVDAAGKVAATLYDALGRVIGTVDGLGNATRQDRDAAGRVVGSTDANGNATAQRHDEDGRLWVTLDPNGGAVTRTYDGNGNLRIYTDPLGNTTTFSYDSLNREIQRTDALGNSLTYAYDTRSRMTSQTDRLGRRKDWTYDDAGRVLTETWVNSGGSTANVLTYTYDDNGNALTAADYDGTYTLTYDNQDRLRTQAGLYGVSLTFSYDALSRRTMVEDSFSGVLSSTYDAAGRLAKRQFGGAGHATLTYERGYTAAGETLWVKRYSDLSSTNLIGTSTYTYDAGYRLTFIQHKDGGGSNLAAYTMAFDAGGRITEEVRNGTSVNYSYDTRSQLTQAGADAYSYDSNGNRTMSGYTTGPGNRLTNDGTFTYTYDLEGNVETKGKGAGLEKWYYAYDHNNRLTSVRKTSDGSTDVLTVTYAYDVFGNRVKEDKWSSGPGLVTTKFVYLGQEVYLDLNNANAVQTRYIEGDQQDEMLVRIGSGNVVSWYLTDIRGSVRNQVDASGTLANTITYDGVGKVASESNAGYLGNVGYAGMGYDSATGLNTTSNREYDPRIARWLQTDQTWFRAGDSNLYRSFGNNFTNVTDPTGLDWSDSLVSWFPNWFNAAIASNGTDNFARVAGVANTYVATPVYHVGRGALTSLYTLGHEFIFGLYDIGQGIGYGIDAQLNLSGWQWAPSRPNWASFSMQWAQEKSDQGYSNSAIVSMAMTSAVDGVITLGTRPIFRALSTSITTGDFQPFIRAVSEWVGGASLPFLPRGLNAAAAWLPRLKPGRPVFGRGGAANGPFDAAGILGRNGDRIVLLQGPNPTCGPVCAAMIAEGEGLIALPENFIVIARQNGWLSANGMLRRDLPKLLDEFRIASREMTGQNLNQLATATAGGRPAIVRLKGADGHFVIVDGVTTRMGERVVAIRNPHGQQYFQRVADFEAQWDNSMVVIEGLR